MATVNWPATLPGPLADGYAEEPPDTSLRTSMDAGPDKVRRRYTAGSRFVTLSYYLSKDEIEILDSFWVSGTLSGSIEFNWTNPRTGAACVARMPAPPQYSAVEAFGMARVTMEVLP